MNPVKAVLDTNIVVSALISKHGIPALLYQMVHDRKLIPFYSDPILQEYKKVLYRPRFTLPHSKVDYLLTLFAMQGEKVAPERSAILMPDESDRKFYDAATSQGIILITGNKKHFPDEPHILTPREFYQSYEPQH
jgi:putative PIN family toxin of toxin-antitoxin system